MKTCPRCKTNKPDTEFYVHKSGIYRGCLVGYCKKCHNRASIAWKRARRAEKIAWLGFKNAEYKLGVRQYVTIDPHRYVTVSPCHLAEARAMLAGKNTWGKNRCVKLPGDEEYDAV